MRVKQLWRSIAAACLVMFFASLGMVHVSKPQPVSAQIVPTNPGQVRKIVLDAGHGGMDGGAVGVNNVVEKNINLSIALKLRDLLTLNGFDVTLTRDSDISLHNKELTNVAKQKRSDMYNRLAIMQANPDALFISIHQNKFPQSGPEGAQIFYSTNLKNSEALASALQTSFKELLQPHNKREIKASGEELFLLYQAKIPAVLVECGFISNSEECAKLVDDTYQSEVAFTILNGIRLYMDSHEESKG